MLFGLNKVIVRFHWELRVWFDILWLTKKSRADYSSKWNGFAWPSRRCDCDRRPPVSDCPLILLLACSATSSIITSSMNNAGALDLWTLWTSEQQGSRAANIAWWQNRYTTPTVISSWMQQSHTSYHNAIADGRDDHYHYPKGPSHSFFQRYNIMDIIFQYFIIRWRWFLVVQQCHSCLCIIMI